MEQYYPEVALCINKSRLKRYSPNLYYLSDGQEFQIEIYNPMQKSIGAEISFNGEIISASKIILTPGERIFLDRYLDSPEKFKFSTYEVENSTRSRENIQRNGEIGITFYLAQESNHVIWNGNNTWNFNMPYGQFGNTYTYDNSGNPTFSSTSEIYSTNNIDTITTGIIGQGAKSNQKFNEYNIELMQTPYTFVSFKILPKNETLIRYKTRNYCTNCSTKLKPEFKFCPACGHKI